MIDFGCSSTCYWHPDLTCDNSLLCDGCKHQPEDEGKLNGKKAPVKIEWEESYGHSIFPMCPSCGEMPYSLERCVFCGQKFIQDDPALQEYAKPPEEVRIDCFSCGGKGTLVGTRAKSNGHFHGKCERCGCRVME